VSSGERRIFSVLVREASLGQPSTKHRRFNAIEVQYKCGITVGLVNPSNWGFERLVSLELEALLFPSVSSARTEDSVLKSSELLFFNVRVIIACGSQIRKHDSSQLRSGSLF